MTFARSPTHHADVSRENFTCTWLPSSKSFKPRQHKRVRHSTISLSRRESLELSSALREPIYDDSYSSSLLVMSLSPSEMLTHPRQNPPRDARPADGAVSRGSRAQPDVVESTQESPIFSNTDDGVSLAHYLNGRCGDKSLSKTLLFRPKGQYAEHQ
jgi:hypothetical protein